MFRGSPSGVVNDSPGVVMLDKQIITGDQLTVDFVRKIDSNYDHYFITFEKVFPSTNGSNLWVRVYHSGGWAASGYLIASGSQNEVEIATNAANNAHGSAWAGARGKLDLYKYDSSVPSNAAIEVDASFPDAAAAQAVQSVSAVIVTPTVISGVRFLTSSGNISGEFRLYGIKK